MSKTWKRVLYFLMLDLTAVLSMSFCSYITIDFEFIFTTVKPRPDLALYLNEVAQFTGFFCGIFVGWVADSYAGKFTVIVVGQAMYVVAPMFALFGWMHLPSETDTKIFYFAIRVVLAMGLATNGVRTAAILDQLSAQKYHDEIEYLIFFLCFMRSAACGISSVLLMRSYYNAQILSKDLLLIFNYMVIIIAITIIFSLTFVKKHLRLKRIRWRIVEKCIAHYWDDLGFKMVNINARKGAPYLKFVSTRTRSIIGLLCSAYGIGIISSVVQTSVIHGIRDKYFKKKMLSAYIGVDCLSYIAVFLYQSLCPMKFRHSNDLSAVVSAYFFTLVSLVALIHSKNYKHGFYPIQGYSQIRLYNGLNETISLSSVWSGTRRIKRGNVATISNIPCRKYCMEKAVVRYRRGKKRCTLYAVERASTTYVLSSDYSLWQAVTKDPVQMPSGNGTSNVLVIFSIFDVTVDLNVNATSHNAAYKSVTSSEIINVPEDVKFIEIVQNGTVVKKKFKIVPGLPYCMFAYYRNNKWRITFETLSQESKRHAEGFLVIPTILSSVSKAAATVSLQRFVRIEPSSKVSCLTNSVLAFALNGGGLVWVFRGSVYNPSKAFLSLIFYVGLALAGIFASKVLQFSFKPFSRYEKAILRGDTKSKTQDDLTEITHQLPKMSMF